MTEESNQSVGLSPGVAVSVGGVSSAVLGLLTAAAGAGWPGVVGLAAVGIAIPFAYNALINFLNGRADARDQARASADAGNTAVDLANQGLEVSHGLDAVQALDPPTDGFAPK